MGATAGLAATLPRVVAPTDAIARASWLRRASYAGRLGETFRAVLPDGSKVSLRLVAVENLIGTSPRGKSLAASEDSFLLEFEGPEMPRLEQGIHELRHPAFGRGMLFLVPHAPERTVTGTPRSSIAAPGRRFIMLSHSPRALLTGALLLATTAGGYAAASVQHAPGQPTRTVLAQTADPAGARGRTLALSRVTIPAHTRLGLHRHPGTQIAYVERGTLTYTVRTGVVSVYRGAGDQNPEVVRRVAAGQRGKVHAGEWVIERPSAVHFGANRSDRPVRILLATLFKTGRPPSIPVTDEDS